MDKHSKINDFFRIFKNSLLDYADTFIGVLSNPSSIGVLSKPSSTTLQNGSTCVFGRTDPIVCNGAKSVGNCDGVTTNMPQKRNSSKPYAGATRLKVIRTRILGELNIPVFVQGDSKSFGNFTVDPDFKKKLCPRLAEAAKWADGDPARKALFVAILSRPDSQKSIAVFGENRLAKFDNEVGILFSMTRKQLEVLKRLTTGLDKDEKLWLEDVIPLSEAEEQARK